MDIVIVGYGRMGRLVDQWAEAHHCTVTHRLDSRSALEAATFAGTEVAIEFTHGQMVVDNLRLLAERGVSTVTGTTGWLDRLPEIEALAITHNIGVLWSANFAIGVQLFWRAVEQVTQTMQAATAYDVFGYEAHHRFKADAPSGTALQTAERVLHHLPQKDTLVTDLPNRALHQNELHWGVMRGGYVPGTHGVVFDSEVDAIELKHTARTRDGFARGALDAARWLEGRTGCYSMDDFMTDTFFAKKD
ncbi:MAG: 4-hydroxy-tetrahydrodipicolinate reductase [Rhodothermales bacterium]